MSIIVGYCVISEHEEMIGCTSNYKTVYKLVSVLCTKCATGEDIDSMEPVEREECHEKGNLCYQAKCNLCGKPLA